MFKTDLEPAATILIPLSTTIWKLEESDRTDGSASRKIAVSFPKRKNKHPDLFYTKYPPEGEDQKRGIRWTPFSVLDNLDFTSALLSSHTLS